MTNSGTWNSQSRVDCQRLQAWKRMGRSGGECVWGFLFDVWKCSKQVVWWLCNSLIFKNHWIVCLNGWILWYVNYVYIIKAIKQGYIFAFASVVCETTFPFHQQHWLWACLIIWEKTVPCWYLHFFYNKWKWLYFCQFPVFLISLCELSFLVFIRIFIESFVFIVISKNNFYVKKF